MILDNLKFLFKLCVRPVAALGDILDRGNWLFSALAVVVVSVLLEFGFVGSLYQGYQAPPTTTQNAPHSVQPQSAQRAADEGQDEDVFPQPKPLPLIGQRAWWFLSFSTTSVLGSVVALAVLE